jgi:hypothetical protein
MKIIDQTPFFNNETGEIKFLDRGKAMMKFGAGWIKEVEAQKQVLTVLDKVLDRSYTLMRNVTPPGLEASFPFILVGPAGVFVMYVTTLTGIFRAKGDQWGTISGNNFKNEKPNLLTRTEHMARAIQIYLQRQGYTGLTIVEPILLCSDPSVHVDSIRPIIRVVMRDALERFAISIMQARVMLSPESVQDVIERILNPPKSVLLPPAETLAETSAVLLPPAETLIATNQETPASVKAEDPFVPELALPESQAPEWNSESSPLPIDETEDHPQVSLRNGLTKIQWAFLAVMFVIWFLLIIVFLFLVIKDQSSFLLSLMP